jgi:hypothetical protein
LKRFSSKKNNFLKITKWTFTNDLVVPFPEIVLFLFVILAASSTPLDAVEADSFLSTVSWEIIYILILFVGIAGIRGYSIALERGEIARQMITLRMSRLRFAFYKWLSLYSLLAVFLLIVDFVVFLLYFAFFPAPSFYIQWGEAPLFTWILMVAEQMLLLFFLNSIVMLISFAVRRSSSVALLVFFAFALLGTQLSTLGLNLSDYYQLGYGDYQIVNALSSYLLRLYEHSSATLSSDTILSGVAYRAIVGAACFAIALWLVERIDMD